MPKFNPKTIKMIIGIIILALCIFFCFYEEPKYKCKICKDTKQVEVLVMGTDIKFVQCENCKHQNQSFI